MMRRILRISIFIFIMVKAEENNETNPIDFDESEYLKENRIQMTEQERFCIDKSEQLNATKHRGFFHGFCMIKCSLSILKWSISSRVCHRDPRV